MLTVIVIYTANNSDATWVILCSILSCASSMSNIIVNPKRIASRYRQAFTILDNAILRYEYSEASSSFNEMIQAVQKGEHIITRGLDLD